MQILTGIMVYIILWWVIFFMTLPVGVTAQDESGEGVVPGTPESAPVKPMLWRKAGATTLIAAVAWGIFYFARTTDWNAVFAVAQ